jgi:23S rRNA pseudouridine1911/1915/1917 synthase
VTHSFQFQINQQDAGRRIDEFCASRFTSLSRVRITNLINGGACLVNGAVARPGSRIVAGDWVEVSFEDGAPTSMYPQAIPLDVVFEDEQLIVVIKPAGMLVHPTMNVKTGTLANALTYHLNREFFNGSRFAIPGSGLPAVQARSRIEPNPELETQNAEPSAREDLLSIIRPGIVHRLDRATSGLMVVAKTPRALTVLSRHFRKRLIEKRYLALVHGDLEGDAGTIVAPIGRDSDERRWGVMDSGKPAETRYLLVERLGRATLLELEPVTGRTNQLRIHCAHIGYPIVGDDLYCGLAIPLPESRLCLHASKLALHHPANGEWIEFSSVLPDDFAAVVHRFRQVL